MSTTTLEKAAMAAFYAFAHDVNENPRLSWDQAPEDFRITFRMVADAVLMTAESDGWTRPDEVPA